MITPRRGDHSKSASTSHRLCFGIANAYLAAMEARMNRPLQFLVAVACVVVIACGTIFLMDRKEMADREAAERELSEMMARSRAEARAQVERAEEQKKVDACAADLRAYDEQNETFSFVQRVTSTGSTLTSDSLLSAVSDCRDLVSSSKPSELPE
tara:strand:- start:7274 stop:7738 length:465 start_codon:yes stop_codon:yes gene_type:complete